MAFFNEFPHTRTYDSDLAWLIKRMKEVLARMDTLENKMAALEELVNNFIETLNIPEEIAAQLTKMINEGAFDELITSLVESFINITFKTATSEQLNALSEAFRAANSNLASANITFTSFKSARMGNIVYYAIGFRLPSGSVAVGGVNLTWGRSPLTNPAVLGDVALPGLDTAGDATYSPFIEFKNTSGDVSYVLQATCLNNGSVSNAYSSVKKALSSSDRYTAYGSYIIM